jgi:hypothetical protein
MEICVDLRNLRETLISQIYAEKMALPGPNDSPF